MLLDVPFFESLDEEERRTSSSRSATRGTLSTS